MGKAFLAVAAVLLTSCASSPAVQQPQQAAATFQPSPSAADLRDFGQALEEARNQIVEKSGEPIPVVHADAALAMPIPDHPSVARALAYFTTDLHDKILTSLHRSAAYKRMIDAAIDQHRLPRGLAYLPVIESAFTPTLTSRVGAHGIWQFMPETGREYGLRITWWIDERADPEKSTRAAVAYLRDLYEEFKDWPLALAAYNCGPGKVRRTLRDRNATTFWQLYDLGALPRETRGYVPTFFATLIIVSDPEMFGFSLPEPAQSNGVEVAIDGPVSLTYLAAVTGVDEKQLRLLNPQLRRGATPPGLYRVTVPRHTADALASRGATLKQEDPFVAVATYTLRGQQTLTSVAKSLGLNPQQVSEMNRGYAAGKTIYLPVRQHDLSLRLSERYHVVRHGDTLFAIARENGLTVAELREMNNLRPGHVIRTGERLLVTAQRSVTAGN